MSNFILSAFADEIDENLKIQMDVLEEFGISHIEMRGVNGRNLTQHSIDEVKEIKRQLDDRGFRISAIGSPIGKIKITDPFFTPPGSFQTYHGNCQYTGNKVYQDIQLFYSQGLRSTGVQERGYRPSWQVYGCRQRLRADTPA